MKEMSISPAVLSGEIAVPPSKSAAHRAIICAALAKGVSRLSPPGNSDDVRATIGAFRQMGVRIETDGGATVYGGAFRRSAEIDCLESGSTLRFLIPVTAALGIHTVFHGRGRLPVRPNRVLTDLLQRHGVECQGDGLPLSVRGQLPPGTYMLPGNISSQYVSGLLLALPLTQKESRILLSTPLESAGYVDMTLQIMREFGISVEKAELGYLIPENQAYRPHDFQIEGDWSQAAFYLAAGALGGKIRILGLSENSAQGDRAAVEIFRRFGANIRFDGSGLSVEKKRLKGIEVDASQIPDMVPALAVTAAFAEGVTRIHSAERLRIKESDRLSAIANGLQSMGIPVKEEPDGLLITGGFPKGGRISGAGDHRIVMAFSIAAAFAEGDSVITDYTAVSKSYPEFFDHFKTLGGNAHVL